MLTCIWRWKAMYEVSHRRCMYLNDTHKHSYLNTKRVTNTGVNSIL